MVRLVGPEIAGLESPRATAIVTTLPALLARSLRRVGLATALVTTGCGPAQLSGAPAERAKPGAESDIEPSAETIVIGRWRGSVVEQHAQFVRYRFVAPGEPDTIVELTPRRPEHGREFGTDEFAVQPAPGAQATPELMRAVTTWLRAERPSPDQLFTAPKAPDPEPSSLPESAAALGQVRSTGVGLLALWLLASLASLRPAWRARLAARSDKPGRARLANLGALLLVVAATLGLRLACAAPTPLDDDALRDVAMGLACAAGDACLHGSTASFGGFEHGAGFPRLLGLLLSAGLSVGALQTVLMILSALAIAVTFDAARRLVDPQIGGYAGTLAAVTLLGLQLTELASTGDILWNPAAMALPAALTGAALLRAATTGRPGLFLLAGLFAGLAFEAHIAGLALWPGLCIVAIATARETDGAVWKFGHRLVWLPAILAAVAVTMVVSPKPAGVNARVLVSHVGWAACVAAALGTVALGFGLRWWLGRSAEPRPWLAGAVALAVPIATLAATLAGAAGFVDSLPIRYLAPVFPVLALAIAWLAATGLARIARARARVVVTALAAGVVLAVTLPAYLDRMLVDRDRWNYADLETVSAFLREQGVGADELHHAVRGGLCGRESHGDRGQRLVRLLVGGLRTLGGLDADPRPHAGPGVRPAWLVAKLRDGELPPLPEGASTLASGSSHTIVLARYRPVADLAAIQYCARFEQDEDRCVPATPQPVNRSERQLLPRHEDPSTPAKASASPGYYYYELPLRWPADSAASRRTTLQIDARSSSQAWRFVNVQGPAGADAQPLPATTLELTLAPGATATVTLATVAPPGDGLPSTDGWWPPLVEVPDHPTMQALFLPRTD